MKFVKLLCVAALIFAVSTVAYAETQSVKISGDIAIRGFARDNYDLQDGDANPTSVVGGPPTNAEERNSWDSFLQSSVEVQVDADLTDNVAAVVRLVNQRVWGTGPYMTVAGSGSTGVTARPFVDRFTPVGIAPGTAGQFDVNADLAYIELKEFLYAPLTLKIGRQNLWFGKGFIVGKHLQDPEAALFAPEYTAVDSFDAIRATLDYHPWTVDAVYAKIQENFMQAADDTNLYGVNVGYVWENAYNAEMEGYYWLKQDKFVSGTIAAAAFAPFMIAVSGEDRIAVNDVHTVGLRGSFDPIEDWTIALEGALQFGEYLGANLQDNRRGRFATALDVMVETRVLQDMYAWKPVLSAEYIYYSGEENMGQDIGNTNFSREGLYTGWDPMFRGKFDTAIREFQNVFYGTNMVSSPSSTNQHQVLVRGKIEPTDDITVDATYGLFWLATKWQTYPDVLRMAGMPANAVPHNENFGVGSEVDLQVSWDYTEDVTFNLLTGWFFPGDHFTSGDIATDVVGTVKLSF